MSPVVAIPAMKKRCPAKKRIRIGSVIKTEPAIHRSQRVWKPWLCRKVARPRGRVYSGCWLR